MITNPLEGSFVRIRIAGDDDAEFTRSIRQSPENAQHIPLLSVDVEEQKKWLQKQRESNDCYFFVVERTDGKRIGTFSLYNIKSKTADSGRLVLHGNQLETLETMVLFHEFAFDTIGLEYIHSEIYSDNLPAIGLSERMGAKKEKQYTDDKSGKPMCSFILSKSDYYRQKVVLEKLVKRYAGRR